MNTDPNSTRRGQWRLWGFLFWLFTVIAAYYVVHKPFGVDNVRAIGAAAAGLAGAALVLAVGTGVGLSLLGQLDLTPVERLVWAAALGLGVVSLVGLGLGALGLLRPWLLWLLTAIGLAATGRSLWRALRMARADPWWRPHGRYQIFLAACCAILLSMALTWALAPPTAWDALDYHLTAPKLYLATGRVSHPIDLPHLGFPQLAEMLFAWGMGLTGELAAASIHWIYGVIGALALAVEGQRRFGSAAGWLAAAVLLSAPTIVALAGWPYVDLVLMLYATLSFLALSRSCEGGSGARRWLVLSGVFAGLAMSTKYTALAVLPALTVVRLLWHPGAVESKVQGAGSIHPPFVICYLRSAICDLLILCGVTLAVWSPWLVKNYVSTGNPTYPFFFGGRYWDDWRTWWYDRPGTGLLYTAPWKLLTAPWDATVWGTEGGFGYSATIGPLFLALLPLLLLAWSRLQPLQRRWLWGGVAFCGVLYGFWLWGIARTELLFQTRLLFPAFGALALMAGAAVEGIGTLPGSSINLGWVVRVVAAVVLLVNLVGIGLKWAREAPQRVILGFESRESYLDRRLGMYHLAVQAVNELPGDSVVLFLWEERSYYCRVDCRPDSLLDRWLHTTHLYGHDAGTIADVWRAEGVTHVLLYRWGYRLVLDAGFDPITEADQEALRQLEQTELELVVDLSGIYQLYALR